MPCLAYVFEHIDHLYTQTTRLDPSLSYVAAYPDIKIFNS